jgi:hypothetical protein
MGLRGFGRFQKLFEIGHMPRRMGLNGDGGDFTRLSYRIKLAKSFRGLDVEGIKKETILGYEGFFQVFLTHSALERYLELVKLQLDGLEEPMKPYNPHEIVERFFRADKGAKFFTFLHERVNPGLKVKLTSCRDGNSVNVGHISAAIRHIFARGHLTARSYGLNPKTTHRSCKEVCDFLLNFIDCHFDAILDEYCSRKQIVLGDD